MESTPERHKLPNGDRTEMSLTVAFILKGYPRLSETFIAQEILALERRGLDILIVSLRRPTDRQCHPIHKEIQAPVTYLPEFPAREPIRVLRAWWRWRGCPGYRAARTLWLRDLRRGPNLARVRSFGQAHSGLSQGTASSGRCRGPLRRNQTAKIVVGRGS